MNSAHVRGIESAVRAAVATLTDAEIRQLTVEPFNELRLEMVTARVA